MGGRNDQSVIKRPLLSRGERWVNRRLSYAFSFFQFGLKCEGTKRIPCDFFFFFLIEGRQAEVHFEINSQKGH